MPATHQQLRDLLEQVLDLATTAEREALLAQCPDPALADEARTMLGLGAGAAALERGAAQLAQLVADPELPARIGPWRIVGLLGRGGMGAVYHGIRDDDGFRMDVAIKVVRDLHSPEQLARFERERALLARLQHPAIARMLDGGCTESGLPWMAIERVQGQTLDVYANAQRLSVRERVTLLTAVIEAVQYAHQNLIVHRDLKPANVMVQADGRPKLLDFGVARLIGEAGHTETAGRAPMTFAYAAPEQVRGEAITTATDVYALGVMLYELLTGARPHRAVDGNPLSLLQAITDTDAAAPSAWLRRHADDTAPASARELEGDLDTIVLKALAREPSRRYPSAQALSDDLARWLDNRPIHARPDAFGYRAGKWIRRNRLSSALAACLVVALLVAATWIVRERDRALQQAEIADASKRFLIHTFTAANRWKTGREVTALDLSLRGLERVAIELKDYPEARAEMYEVLGHTLGRASPLAQGARARELQVAELRKLEPASSQRLVEAEYELVLAYWYAEMLPQLQRQLSWFEQEYAGAMPDWIGISLQTMRLDVPRFQGDHGTVLATIERNRDAWRAIAGRIPPERQSSFRVLHTHVDWARQDVYRVAARDREARAAALGMLRHAARDLAGDGHVQAHYTGFAICPPNRVSPARRARARAWAAAHFGEDAGFVAWQDLDQLDYALREQDLDRASALHQRLHDVLGRYPEESLFELRDLDLLGAELALARGDRDAAGERWQRALTRSRDSDAHLVFAHDRPFESHHTREASAGLAWLALLRGESPDALRAVAARQSRHDDGAWRVSASRLAAWHAERGEDAQARALLAEILDWQRARDADPDARLDPLFARYGFVQHPARIDAAGQAEFERLIDTLVAAGEQRTAELKATTSGD
jgi:hypothetical protein